MGVDTIREVILVLVPMILCLSVHEYAHAQSAQWLGDDTARLKGRMTLNPISHIDIFGTLLLPILFVVSNSNFFFGWAKPVPVNPMRFTRLIRGQRVTMRTGMMLTAAAGPASNLVFGLVSGVILKIVLMAGIMSEPVLVILLRMMVINYALAVFNMIPLPPLDGSKVLAGFVPREWTRYFDYLEQNTLLAFVILIALLRTGILSKVMGPIIFALIGATDAILGLGTGM